MKAVFVAPDLVILAQMLSVSTDTKEFVENVKNVFEGDDSEEKIDSIANNPSSLRYSWLRLEKNEDNIDFLSALLLLSANNNYAVTAKDVIFTNDSAFVNINILKSFKEVSGDEKFDFDVDIAGKINKEKSISIAENLFDSPQFMELYSDGNGAPEMLLLSGTMSVDTWSLLSTLGITSYRSFGKSDGDATKKVPGMCILFGLSATTLMHIVNNADKLPKHIGDDLQKLPKAEKPAEEEK